MRARVVFLTSARQPDNFGHAGMLRVSRNVFNILMKPDCLPKWTRVRGSCSVER
jgi:hypothetical protein